MRIKPLSTDNLMARFLAGLAGGATHPRLFLYPQLVLPGASW